MANFEDVMLGLGTVLFGGLVVAAAASNPEAFAESLNEGLNKQKADAVPQATPEDILALENRLHAYAWDTERTEAIKGLVTFCRVTCEDLATLVGPYDFDKGRIAAVKEVLRGKGVVDPHNASALDGMFTFSSGARKAGTLIRELS